MNIHFISGNKRVFLNTILNHHLYVGKKWNIYIWLKFYSHLPPILLKCIKFYITLVFANNKPIGDIVSHIMIYTNPDTQVETEVLCLELFILKKYRGKGIGSKMLKWHLNNLPNDYKHHPILFQYGLISNNSVIDHFEKKYDDIRFHIPVKGDSSNESN